MNETADAVVIGGGVMGCSILYNLAAKGVERPVLFERGVLGAGSSGRSQAILRMHYSNEVTTRMAWQSLDAFKHFEEITGLSSGYVKTGYLLIAGPEDRSALFENVAAQQRMGVTTEVLTAEDVEEAAPGFLIRDSEMCAFESESGYVDPHAVMRGYAQCAQSMRAMVHMGVGVDGVEVIDGAVKSVSTSRGRVSTPVVIVATGPWSRTFLGKIGLDVPLETVRHQVVALERTEGIPCHSTVGDLVNSFSARSDEGSQTLVGIGEAETAIPEDYDEGIGAGVAVEVAAAVASRMPAMSRARIGKGWSGLFTVTPDWHPILGPVEEVEGLYLAVGFSGHGFKLSPMVGVVLAEMISEGRSESIDVSMLGLDRFEQNKLLRSRYGMSVLA